MPFNKFNITLRLAMSARRKSQRDVAFECVPRISESRLSNIVRGYAEPREAEKAAIAIALGVPIDELFADEQPEPVVVAPAESSHAGR